MDDCSPAQDNSVLDGYARTTVGTAGDGKYIALLVAYNAIKRKYCDLKKDVRLKARYNMNHSLNQLDSPTEADQLQMLLEMKSKECEALIVKVKEQTEAESRYLKELQTGQENLDYALRETDKLRSELEKLYSEKSSTKCQICKDQCMKNGDVKVLSRGAIDQLSREDILERGSEQSQEMEKQIKALTLEKKQWMTHVHWLTNELRIKDDKLRDAMETRSSHEGDQGVEDMRKNAHVITWFGTEGNSLEEGVQLDVCARQRPSVQMTDACIQTVSVEALDTKEEIQNRVRRMRDCLAIVKETLQHTIVNSDSIYHSAIRGVRHPWEPRVYSDINNIDGKIPYGDFSCTERRQVVPKVHTDFSRGKSRQSSVTRLLEDPEMYSSCPSVYHSTVASPQDMTEDESALYIPCRRNFALETAVKSRLLRCAGMVERTDGEYHLSAEEQAFETVIPTSEHLREIKLPVCEKILSENVSSERDMNSYASRRLQQMHPTTRETVQKGPVSLVGQSEKTYPYSLFKSQEFNTLHDTGRTSYSRDGSL